MNCPTCGRPASGKFCSECGVSLAGAACRSCGAPLSPGGKFCHLCGTPHTSRQAPARTSGNMIGLIVGAVAVVILIVVVVTQKSGPAAPAGTAAPPGMGAATSDLSSMTPRERADRLFDRVMRAASVGDSAEITFFTPMAVQSYEMLDALDADARYHVALLQVELGNFSGALAQADTLERSIASHLFVPLIRGEAATRQGNQAEKLRWYRRFLDAYDRELATAKQEYSDHQPALDGFRDAARAATSATR